MVCTNKKSYDTKKHAKIVAERRSKIVGYPLYVYRCKKTYCKKYHLSKLTKKEKRAKVNKYKKP